jgi:co-chaperonin GroES (HSP10)
VTGLRQSVDALNEDALDDADDKLVFQERFAALEASVGSVNTLDDAVQRITALEAQVQGLLAVNSNLKNALQTGTVPALATEPSKLKGADAPLIEADGGDITLTVQDGRHLKVNGKQLLTADEIVAIVASAIQKVADAM